MNISFRKLLPKKMRNTAWGELIDVFQDMYSDLKEEKVNRIFNQFDIDKNSKEEKIELAKTFGFNLLTLDGYTCTDDFINKEIRTIIPRIVSKTAMPSYNYTSYCFNLISNLYAISATNTGELSTARLSTIYDPETQITYATTELDQGGDNILYFTDYTPWQLDFETGDDWEFQLDSDEETRTTLDAQWIVYDDPIETGKEDTTLDSYDFLTLDASTGTETGGGEAIITQITRNLNYNYKHKFIENVNEFMSLETLKVLKNDIDQIHKATEVIYYTPILEISVNLNKTPKTQEYTSYDLSLTANQNSLLVGNLFNEYYYVEFGTGTQSISGVITGVNNFSYRYPDYNISGIIPSGVIHYFDNVCSGCIAFDFNIEERNKFTEFTECAIYDVNSGLVLYSTFPKMQWDKYMYNNVQFQIKHV